MAISNLIALAIMIATAATLHAPGKTDITTAAQAAEALRPIAGNFAFLLFSLGIIGTGLLAVPVLAGSAAFAVGEARGWKVGLEYKDGGRPEAFGNGQVHCFGLASVFRLGGNGCYGNGGGRNVRATVSVTDLIGAYILLKVSFG